MEIALSTVSETSISLSKSEQRDLLPALIQLFYVVAPLQILMIYAGTTEVTAGMAGGTVLGAVGLLSIASSRLTLPWCADRPIAYMFLFLCVGSLSTLQTPYGPPAIQRGVINIAAMLAMVSTVFVVRQACVQWPWLFPHIVRITAITTGVAGLTAVFHFFVANVLSLPELFDLTSINEFWDQPWWRSAEQGGLTRAQGIFGEPSFLAAFVGMAAGLAIIRLGVFGSQWRRSVGSVVPLWAAWGILGSLILSFSAVVYASLLATCLGALASKTTFSFRSILLLAMGSVVALAILVLLALQAGDVIVGRIAGMAVFGQLNDFGQGDTLDPETNLSVQILFLNAYVTLQNLIANPWLGAGVGAHPFAYEAVLSGMPTFLLPEGAGINTMDASALLLRLLSETGVVGTAVFAVAILSAWFRARKVALSAEAHADPADQSLRAIATGLNGSLIGVVSAMMLHIPHYYAAEFWALFALCVAIPAIAANATRTGPYRETTLRPGTR